MEKSTRLMETLFSNKDPEIAEQVDSDIRQAMFSGEEVDTEELNYKKVGDGSVAITDKGNGQVTIAQESDEPETYDLVAVPDGELERYLHPTKDGQPDESKTGAPDEHFEDHAVDGNCCPKCGKNPCTCECPGDECKDDNNICVSSDNEAVKGILAQPREFCDKLFSDVIETSDTAKVGDLVVEKSGDDSVIVTSENTGDKAEVTLTDDEMKIKEIGDKTFSEQYMPLFIIGVHPYDHYLVDAQAYTEDAANELVSRLENDGIEQVRVFESQDDAREYAAQLLDACGADIENGDVEEPVLEKEYSDCSIYTTSYNTNNTVLMSRMFSEEDAGVSDIRDAVEDVISKNEPTELAGMNVIPSDENSAIIEDGGEKTKVSIDGEDMLLENMTGEENDDSEEKDYSDIYSDEAQTRFFSENEPMTNYMQRLFSEEADQDHIEEALSDRKQIETDDEIITPVSDDTAVIEDKENGECTKATLEDDDTMNVEAIDHDEAEELTDGVEVSDEEEKEYSDIYSDEAETRFFSEAETMTDYMQRLFSEEADQNHIEEALNDKKQIETENEIITPVSDDTAVIEDKENGECTKVTLEDDDTMNVEAIDHDEAEELTDGVEVSDEEEKEYSVYSDEAETRFFSEAETMTDYMQRLFSEEADQNHIEEALGDEKQIETEDEIITPVSEDTAVIEDKNNGEYTKATLEDDDTMNVEAIDSDEADELTDGVELSDEEEDEDEKSFSEEDQIYSNEAETRFFSESEPMTEYMQRLFTEESDQNYIEEAINTATPLETEKEVITPISDDTAIISDKENGEYTKAVLFDDDRINIHPVGEDEIQSMLEDGSEEVKEYSEEDQIYSNEAQTRFFSESETITNYMQRLFSEEADQDEIEKAISSGDVVNTDNEVITPIDSETAIIDDNGEYTKATLEDDDTMNVEPIDKDEAEKELKGKNYSTYCMSPLNKFFAQVEQSQLTDQTQIPVEQQQIQQVQETPVEAIEDKAVAAIQSIQAAASEASAEVMNAKAAPAPNAEPSIQEARFSEEPEEKTFSDSTDTLISWLQNK